MTVKLQLLACIAIASLSACAPDPISTSKGASTLPTTSGNGDTMIGTLIGDFNSDGVVNAADFDLFKKKYSYTVYPPGDYNQDGVVDSADLTIYNSGSPAADGNADGRVDQGDFVVFTDNYNKGSVSYDAGDLDRDNDVDMEDFKLWREIEKKELEKKQ